MFKNELVFNKCFISALVMKNKRVIPFDSSLAARMEPVAKRLENIEELIAIKRIAYYQDTERLIGCIRESGLIEEEGEQAYINMGKARACENWEKYAPTLGLGPEMAGELAMNF